MMQKMRCYFAHPTQYKDTNDKNRIVIELLSRRLKIVDPFEIEQELLKKFGVKSYFEGESYELGRAIATQDLKAISSAQIVVAWVPAIDDLFLSKNPVYHTLGVGAELQYAYGRGKFIQIISPIHHPFFTLYADEHQYFESIEEWIWHKDYKWRRHKK